MKSSKKTPFIITKGRHLQKPEKKKLSLAVKISASAVLLIAALAVGVLAFIKHGGQAPEVKHSPTTPHAPLQSASPSAPPTGDAETSAPPASVRDKNKFTFVVFGTDAGGGNTDVIMVATLDTGKNTLNVVNIPRDTLVNVSWSTKKVNSLLAYMKGPEGAVTKLADMLGYEVDFYAVVDLKAFESLVDAVGGIDFEVPRNMEYDDPAQNLSIHIAKGMRHLSGKDALGVVRFRKGNNNTGYASGDIGRIETQQKFLIAAAGQILEKKSSINIASLANIFLKYVKTNLGLQELVWFGKEIFKLSIEGVSFTTLPGNINDSINGDSYVTIYLEQWIELINEKLNPFSAPITTANLSIYTRDANKQLYVTDGHYEGKESWGRGSSSSSSSTPKPTAAATAPPPAATGDMDAGTEETPPGAAETPENSAPPDMTPDITDAPPETPEPPLATPPETTFPALVPPETTATMPPATPPDPELSY
ncbi:MAG: LCP family protein [Oscillospiraceae bacterium]|jgi:LCP family protein required for cell wall assembly|nr:LCP family protein [Oscillospiraceae bacterium]